MNRETERLRRRYGALTDWERFRAVLAAWERNDESEVKALGETARKATYRMTAWPYRGMLDAIQQATRLAIIDVLQQGMFVAFFLGLSLASGIVENKAASSEHLAGAGDDGEDGDDESDDRPDPLEVLPEVAEKVLAAWDGLGLFCQELGVTVPQALAQTGLGSFTDLPLELARMTLDFDEEQAQILARVLHKEYGQDPAAILADRATNIARRREQQAREYADLLRRAFDLEAGL